MISWLLLKLHSKIKGFSYFGCVAFLRASISFHEYLIEYPVGGASDLGTGHDRADSHATR